MSGYMEGFKAFDSEFKTFNGMKFEEGGTYHTDGTIKAGPCGGNGFHFCENFEDTFRYVPRENPILCKVIAFGNISPEDPDEYYGYYGKYACSDIYIERVVSRAEITQMAKTLGQDALNRLIQTYAMTDEEIEEIKRPTDKKVMQFIDYYHNGNKKAFGE